MHHDLTTQTKQTIVSRCKYIFIGAFMAFGFMIISTEPAIAQTSPMGDVICAIIAIVYGNLGRGLAVLAVIIVGVGATLGKVSWGLALTVITGIATIFGAVPLVSHLLESMGASNGVCYGSSSIS